MSIVTNIDSTLPKDTVSAEAANANAMPRVSDGDYALPKDAVSAVASGVKATASLCSAIVRSTERMMTRRMRARAGSLPASDPQAPHQLSTQLNDPEQQQSQINTLEQQQSQLNTPEQHSTHLNSLEQHSTQLSGPEQAVPAQSDATARVEPDGMVVLDSTDGHATFDREASEDVGAESLDRIGSNAQHQSLPGADDNSAPKGEGHQEPAVKDADTVPTSSFDSERLVSC